MHQKLVDIWFGPGALKGIFGAGVAYGLQESCAAQEIDFAKVRLFGSSVGCLTAAFLATGNTGCGLDIFRDDTRELIMKRNLVPALGARAVNRMAMVSKRVKQIVPVPSVLNVAHVFEVLSRRTPDIQDRLRTAPMPVFAETVSPSGEIQHAELRSAQDPMAEIRSSLNAYPFTGLPELNLLDSAIHGYGFAKLLHDADRVLVVVLNERPAYTTTESFADVACAALCGRLAIARMYLGRQRNRSAAISLARQRRHDVLLVTPQRTTAFRRPADFERVHREGKDAARHIVMFLNQRQSAGFGP